MHLQERSARKGRESTAACAAARAAACAAACGTHKTIAQLLKDDVEALRSHAALKRVQRACARRRHTCDTPPPRVRADRCEESAAFKEKWKPSSRRGCGLQAGVMRQRSSARARAMRPARATGCKRVRSAAKCAARAPSYASTHAGRVTCDAAQGLDATVQGQP
eukprot:683936-Pleurochrysis_carterae.AAC.3